MRALCASRSACPAPNGRAGWSIVNQSSPSPDIPGWRPVSRLRTRSALEIGHSPWTIGIETIDRAYVDFAPIAPHLGPLGATEARAQAGWARCDHGPGRPYKWAWLDEVVDGCIAQGVHPWLQTSYGNPAYPGGGGIGLGQGVPTSPEALAAWDRWIDALVARYHDRVDIWEIWNEADHSGDVTVEQYTGLFLRTARQIRKHQPGAHIIALSMGGDLAYAAAFLRVIAEMGEGRLINSITFHGYPHNPDDGFEMPEFLAPLCADILPHVELRQGETGSPSRQMDGRHLALNSHPFSERKQAVWNLRRMINHHRRGFRMSLFQLADMIYEPKDGALFDLINPKGLLAIDHQTREVTHRKRSYHAAQHVFSLLDSCYPLRPLDLLPTPEGITACAWQRTDRERPNLVIWWKSDAPPSLQDTAPTGLRLDMEPMRDPILLDLLNGTAHEADGPWPVALPCSDSPLALIERDTFDAVPLPS